jgi:hypothetical protein
LSAAGSRAEKKKPPMPVTLVTGAIVAARRLGCRAMCAQCMTTAVAAVGAASGLRAWLATRGGSWLTAARLRAVTIGLIACAVLATATLSSSGA